MRSGSLQPLEQIGGRRKWLIVPGLVHLQDMNISPEMMKAAGEMMKNMTSEDMQRMASMVGGMESGNGGPGGTFSSPSLQHPPCPFPLLLPSLKSVDSNKSPGQDLNPPRYF